MQAWVFFSSVLELRFAFFLGICIFAAAKPIAMSAGILSPNGSYIVIEGNIGAGKTSLCQRLAADFNMRLLLEAFADNPFLPNFYEQPKRFAFPVELFFMAERHKQLQELLGQGDLFQQGLVADYMFSKTLLFAQQNLEGHEWRLFQRLFQTLNQQLPAPQLLVYLHRPIAVLQAHIRKRQRSYEQNISDAYLEKVQQAYLQFFKHSDLPILLIELGAADFLEEKGAYEAILDLLQQPYSVGVHRAVL